MLSRVRVGALLGITFLTLQVGCASIEHASVQFSYVVDAQRGLPAGMKTIAISPAKTGPNTDEKWSEICVSIMQDLVNESRNRFGTDITITDRRDTQVTFDEADLAAAGMSTRSGGQPAQLLAADGVILSNINVKIEKHMGKQTTLSGLSIDAWRGRGWGGGGTDIRTREVDTVTRSMTVQTDFKLVDTTNNKIWDQFSPQPFRATDRTKASAIFGSSQTEAALTPQDEIISSLVEQAAREFISRLMPCRVDVEASVSSSGNADCIEGVRLLRGDMFGDAYYSFKKAMADNADDHRAAFGAGVACEASGRYDDALRLYNRALQGAGNPAYRKARDRMKTYGARIRQ